jgi:hypothetical protein
MHPPVRFLRSLVLAAVMLVSATAVPRAEAPSAGERIEGASRIAFQLWLAFRPARAAEVNAFSGYLTDHGVGGVFPVHQILRSESSWRRCSGEPFAMPPRELWPNVVDTLKFIRDRVIPETGQLEVVSGYRTPDANRCAGGASQSAHVGFWALDMVPAARIDRDQMIARLCAMHARHGARANAGLGFYNGMRFHIDTKRFRRWGADRSGGSSPCAGITG